MTDAEAQPVEALVADLARIEGHMDALSERKERLRQVLDARLRKVYADTGALPMLKIKGVGSAALVGGGEPVARVIQPTIWSEWCAEHVPAWTTFVIEVKTNRVDSDTFQRAWALLQPLAESTSTRVDDDVLAAIVRTGTLDADAGVLIDAEGIKVEGVTVTVPEPSLRVRPAPEAKAAAAAEVGG